MLKKSLLLATTLLFTPLSFSKDMPDQFEATYNSFYKGNLVGSLTRTFTMNDGKFIAQTKSNIDAMYGIIPVTDIRTETSYFQLKDDSIIPEKYIMTRTGTWLDFTMNIDFDYSNSLVNFKYKGDEVTKPINGNILDNATYPIFLQYQAKNGNLTKLKKDVAYKRGFRDYNFKYKGSESITINGKEIKDLLLFQQVRSNKKNEKKASYSWLDPKKDFILTKILIVDKNGEDVARFELTNYKKL